ncbi:MAG: hypothetical protein LQ342_002879 [Letrouitia transgressa]|nr:MAG: hypothetical protein LQ342_002879 [Letrouitia transgressa]
MTRRATKTDLPVERMTLIRNRGRRGQRARLKAQKAERLAAEALFNEDNTSVSLNSFHQVLSQSSRRAPLGLQHLPIEILQSIFLFSRNLDFARASPQFAAAFASNHVKNEVLHMAFPMLRDPALAQKLTADYPDDGLSEMQSAVLRLKWVTFDVMREALLKSQIAYLTSRCQGYSMMEIDYDGAETGRVIQPHESSIRSFFEGIRKERTAIKDVKVQNREGSGKKIRFRTSAIRFLEQPLEHKQWDDSRYLQPLQCGQRCILPEKLLHGPWSDAKCGFLELIFWCGAVLDSFNSSNGEVADAGLLDAIMEGNHRVVEVLSQLRDVATKNIRKNKIVFPVLVTTRHIKAAILQEDCDVRMVSHLLHNATRLALLIDDDKEVKQWAYEKKAAGDRRGDDLLGLLDHFRGYPRMIPPGG